MRIKKCRTCDGDILVRHNNKDKDDVFCNKCGQKYIIFSLYPPQPIYLKPMDPEDDYCLEEDY